MSLTFEFDSFFRFPHSLPKCTKQRNQIAFFILEQIKKNLNCGSAQTAHTRSPTTYSCFEHRHLLRNQGVGEMISMTMSLCKGSGCLSHHRPENMLTYSV